MRRQDITVSSATASSPVPVNPQAQVFNIGMGCVISAGGSLTYTVQHTFDDIWDPAYNPATGNWFNHSVLVNKTSNADSTYTSPVTAIRVNVTVYASGSVTVTLLQSAGPGF